MIKDSDVLQVLTIANQAANAAGARADKFLKIALRKNPEKRVEFDKLVADFCYGKIDRSSFDMRMEELFKGKPFFMYHIKVFATVCEQQAAKFKTLANKIKKRCGNGVYKSFVGLLVKYQAKQSVVKPADLGWCE
ncbi:hypothetical protein PIB30_004432 [Stylosanthes scabra]|uniref:Uncharacterized protein n=1 Tax=Stylosanthes scabra TaxID=79078 RepID=A0ABU6V683_9FABA|nr:hypothetical protein [Stylosanthes scabra]